MWRWVYDNVKDVFDRFDMGYDTDGSGQCTYVASTRVARRDKAYIRPHGRYGIFKRIEECSAEGGGPSLYGRGGRR